MTDYDCNLRAYRQEMRDHPPDCGGAPRLAGAEYLRRNVQNVVKENDDYVAASLLRVLAEYPEATRQKLCTNSRIRGALQRRGELIRSPFEYGEYASIFHQGLGCRS